MMRGSKIMLHHYTQIYFKNDSYGRNTRSTREPTHDASSEGLRV